MNAPAEAAYMPFSPAEAAYLPFAPIPLDVPADGSFADGSFADGSFADGSFADGPFPDGSFAVGSFADGSFADGSFADGSFADGSFADGSFPDGSFADGSFADGSFAVGSFADGSFDYYDPFYPELEPLPAHPHCNPTVERPPPPPSPPRQQSPPPPHKPRPRAPPPFAGARHCGGKASTNKPLAGKALAGGAEARRRLAAVLCEAAAAAGVEAGVSPVSAPTITCSACDALPRAPWTAACGHALCGACWPCPRCQASAIPAPKQRLPSVLLRSVQEACWPRELRAQALLAQGEAAAVRNLLRDTDDSESDASPLLLSLYCHALYLLDCHREALVVADKLRQRNPAWARSHYWRGCFLLMVCRPQEALTALLLSVALSTGLAPPNPAGMPSPHTLIQAGLGQLCSLSEEHLQMIVSWITKETTCVKRLENKLCNELVAVPVRIPSGLDEADFECVLCSRILWKPVTTPCGHTFCAGCLDRCLDHTAACPLCMAPLRDLISSSRCVTAAVETIVKQLLPPSAMHSRELSARAEIAAPAHVPVFVCTVAWPGVPCPLYVFEPRYRLLVRRCVESGDRGFGMAAGSDGHGFVDIGTLLDVRDWLRLPDGCSLLTAVGARRFRVLARGERDGYHTARVELLRDIPPGPGITELAAHVWKRGQNWVARMPQSARAEVERAFGPMPPQESGECFSQPDGPAWAWWLLAIFPLSARLQVAILANTSLEKRLLAIDKTLDRLNERDR